jgi:hypothetical protein
MQILRSIAAVVAGFGFMASTAMVGTILATALFMPGPPTSGAVPALYLAMKLGTTLIGAIFGGWIAARIALSAPMAHALALAALTAVLSVASAQQTAPSGQPVWYPILVGILGVAGILLGGKLRTAAAAAGGAVVA